jgi:cytidylate kinase
MTTITISRQMGSLGSDVAFLVAERLGYRLVWRELINLAARRAGAPEMALAAIDELDLLGLTPSPQAQRAYIEEVNRIVNELAEQGNVVILGRAGQVILHGRPETLHVRIFAPQALRVKRVAEKLGVTIDKAAAQVEASDRYRARYLRRFYHVRWDDPALYHLVLNTAHLTSAQAADIICRAAANLSHLTMLPKPNSQD